MGYNIYRDGRRPRTKIKPESGARMAYATPDWREYCPPTSHTYTVRAVDTVGNESNDVVNNGCPSLEWRRLLQGLRASRSSEERRVTGDCADGGKATITWDANQDDEPSKILLCVPRRLTARRSAGTGCRDSRPNTSSRILAWIRRGATSTRDSGGRGPQRVANVPQVAYAPNRLSLTSSPTPTDKIIVTPGTDRSRCTSRPPADGCQPDRLLAIYREANADPSCGAFQLWGRLVLYRSMHDGYVSASAQRTPVLRRCLPVRLVDGAAPTPSPTIMRWHRAMRAARSSGLTKTALAIPTARR